MPTVCGIVPPMALPSPRSAASPAGRRLLDAELLSIGTELTVGETLDTNAGEIARSLVATGVRTRRIQALPDDLPIVRDAFVAALERVELVVSTGGLGPTPDDLTREAIAAACGEELAIDPSLEAWLRERWSRRGLPFPESNLKQAWLIPSAVALPNPNGSAPGWFVQRPDGRVIVALPGPPREMLPMWRNEALPRLAERGVGRDAVVRTLRLSGIGESTVAERLGDALLRSTNPIVATYARLDGVDVRVSAFSDGDTTAEELADQAERRVVAAVGEHVWAHGATTWPEAVGAELDRLGWTLAIVEHGLGGSLVALLGDLGAVRHAEVVPDATIGAAEDEAEAERQRAAADVGLAVAARERAEDTAVEIAVATPAGRRHERRIAFFRGPQGHAGAAITAAFALLTVLREAHAVAERTAR